MGIYGSYKIVEDNIIDNILNGFIDIDSMNLYKQIDLDIDKAWQGLIYLFTGDLFIDEDETEFFDYLYEFFEKIIELYKKASNEQKGILFYIC